MRRISVNISCGFAWQGDATTLASSAATISPATNPGRSARIFLSLRSAFVRACYRDPIGQQQGESGNVTARVRWSAGGSGASDDANYIGIVISAHALAFSIAQVSGNPSVVGLFSCRRVGRALLVWRIPGKLADGRPLQRWPVAAAIPPSPGNNP